METLARIGLPAFTFGGCGDGLPAGCEQYLAGRQVVILADNDDEGRNHAGKKAALAFPVAASVRVVQFDDVPKKGDVSDWIEAGHTADDLRTRATAPIENIWCEKIRGCSCRARGNVRYALIAANFRFTAE